MKGFWNDNKQKIFAFLLLGFVIVGVVSGIAVVGGALMSVFGFVYSSIWNIILFFIVATLLSFPLSLLAETLPNVLLFFKRVTKRTAILLYILLDTIATSFGLYIVDYFMDGVSATNGSIVVVSLLLSLICVNDIGKKPRGVLS